MKGPRIKVRAPPEAIARTERFSLLIDSWQTAPEPRSASGASLNKPAKAIIVDDGMKQGIKIGSFAEQRSVREGQRND